MPFKHDSTGVNPDAFPLLPADEYVFRIVDAREEISKKGYHMVKTEIEVAEGDHKGFQLTHYVVFIPKGQKGDGINVHFRKCINVPFGGDDEVNAADWVGRRFKATVSVDDENYVKDGVRKQIKKNNLKKIEAIEGANAPVDSEVPF